MPIRHDDGVNKTGSHPELSEAVSETEEAANCGSGTNVGGVRQLSVGPNYPSHGHRGTAGRLRMAWISAPGERYAAYFLHV